MVDVGAVNAAAGTFGRGIAGLMQQQQQQQQQQLLQ